LGVIVIVLDGPAAIKENQTSFTATRLHVLVVFDDVAPREEELMHIVPLGGMIMGWAVRQLSFAGCAKASVGRHNNRNTKIPIELRPLSALSISLNRNI
jgi:hypothetical protein